MSEAIAAVIGFMLGIGWDMFRSWYADRENTKKMRALLAQEIDFNLSYLKGIYKRVTSTREKERNRENTEESAAVALSRFRPEAVSNSVWLSYIRNLPSALNETEIAEVFSFYSNLEETISEQKTYLSLQLLPRGSQRDPYHIPAHFYQADRVLDRLELIVENNLVFNKDNISELNENPGSIFLSGLGVGMIIVVLLFVAIGNL